METVTNIKTGMSFFKLFKIAFAIFFIIILFSKPVYVFLDTKDFSQALFELSKSFIASSKALEEDCKDIISNGLVFEGWKTSSKSLVLLAHLVSSLSIVFLYLWCIMWILDKFSSQTSFVFKFFIALIVFYFIEVIFLLGFYGYLGKIEGITGDSSIIYYLSLPFTSLVLVIKTMYIVLNPVKNVLKPLIDKENNITNVFHDISKSINSTG